MAVSLDTITPADGAVEVWPDCGVEVALSDSSDLDPALLEVTVDGTSCTVANGRLATWQGTSAHYLYAVTQGVQWFDTSAEEITVTVVYNSATLDTTTFTAVEVGTGYNVACVSFMTDGYQGAVQGCGGTAGFAVVDMAWDYCRGELGYGAVDSMRPGSMDADYYVAHLATWDCPSSGVVGVPQFTDIPASGVVQGWTPSYCPSSGLVQAWLRHDPPASGIVGVRFCAEGPASGIVGTVTTTHGPASGVVYAVNRRNAIDVQVIDSSLYTSLTSLGVTWS